MLFLSVLLKLGLILSITNYKWTLQVCLNFNFYEQFFILVYFLDGTICGHTNWSTVINFICSHKNETQILHISTNESLCTNVFLWKTPNACPVLVKLIILFVNQLFYIILLLKVKYLIIFFSSEKRMIALDYILTFLEWFMM